MNQVERLRRERVLRDVMLLRHVGLGELREVPDIEVGDEHVNPRANLVAQPASNRAAAPTDLEAAPAGANPEAGEVAEGAGV